jgi:hypothetical protein
VEDVGARGGGAVVTGEPVGGGGVVAGPGTGPGSTLASAGEAVSGVAGPIESGKLAVSELVAEASGST